ncbi:MAG: BlaI/MecI/CopY family transcriptional regulator [Clostridiaceae bacterium]|jgi:predicted transcriptional regulator|nr:BlaI/MecI/CopY family transcriptional regulator [Oscillospiraceae bacterium]NLO63214.1 BlaI/MecI/CopY family transcriptional regulator [Clostridiaceae bacterium]
MQKITESEMIIMDLIWDAGKKVNSAYVIGNLPERIKWKMTTVTTFLSRLTGRGMIEIVEKKGRTNFYLPTMTREEYSLRVTRDAMLGTGIGSIKNLIASLYKTNDISKKSISNLKEWLSEEGYEGEEEE